VFELEVLRMTAFRLNRAAGVVLALALAAPPAQAQGKLPPVPRDMSSLIGAVDDSIRGGRLAGALVTVVDANRSGVTDANGIFMIDSIAPGEHRLVVTHPMLDTLNVQIVSDPIMLLAGERQEVEAHTPSFEEVRAKACTRGAVGTGTSILVGRVIQADNGEPAAGASVSLVYKDVSQKDAVEKVRTGRVAANGSFAICGLPSTLSGNLQAAFHGVTTADLPLNTTDVSISTAILSIGGTSTGTSVLRGTVTAKGGGPIEGAQVTVVGTTTVAITSAGGAFTLTNLPSGTHEAVIRKIGFAKASQIVQLTSATPISVNIALEQATVLGTVHIIGKMDDGLAKLGFLSRKQMGRGWYLTPEQIADKNPNMTTDLFRMAQGIRLMDQGRGRYVMSTSSTGSTTPGCINFFIDHARFDQFQPGDIDDAVPTADLGAIEYYSNPSSVPTEFVVPGKTCAALVIWTKTLLTTLKP
jgi:hypothetical protein